MDFARQTAVSRLQKSLCEITTIRRGDSFWQIAERLLRVNNNPPEVALISKVAAMLFEEHRSTLTPGENLFLAALAVRTRCRVLKRELDQHARRILSEERQRNQYSGRRRSDWPAPVGFSDHSFNSSYS